MGASKPFQALFTQPAKGLGVLVGQDKKLVDVQELDTKITRHAFTAANLLVD